MGPMEGARAFLDQLREDYQVIILSDTFFLSSEISALPNSGLLICMDGTSLKQNIIIRITATAP